MYDRFPHLSGGEAPQTGELALTHPDEDVWVYVGPLRLLHLKSKPNEER
jgi:hypothetical protein